MARLTSPVILPVDVEIVDLLEAEQLAVERPPLVHVAAVDVVGEVIEIVEADALRPGIALAQPLELGIVGRALLPGFLTKYSSEPPMPTIAGTSSALSLPS